MNVLRLPWLELGVFIPLIGALWVRFRSDPDDARRHGLIVAGLTLVCMIGGWVDFESLQTNDARDSWSPLAYLFGRNVFVVDELSAPLLALTALLYFLTILSTMRAKARVFSFERSLTSEAILLATFACAIPWGLVALLALGTVPPYLELRQNKKPTRVYLAHMGLFILLLVLGEIAVERTASSSEQSLIAILLLTAAVLVRSGVVPVHCWMTDLFEHASLGTAILFVTPMVGVYGVARIILPVAPQWALQAISMISLFTALYAAGMALVQREARRFFCYLFLSHSSLVLVGIETAVPVGLTGSLSLWLSVALSMTGFGLALRCVESRVGRILLTEFHGLYEQIPMMAGLFLLTGLASIGFPGTVGFVGVELVVEGAVQALPLVAPLVVVVTALNGLAVIQAYFRIFTGRPYPSTIDLQVRPSERASVLIISALILVGGLYPQLGVSNRYRAALKLVGMRSHGEAPTPAHDHRPPQVGLNLAPDAPR
ncbi:proton-conducting transporter membrane subunit [Paludisphaera borealis]|uniref:NAD(P)H-quinone oxidoreductase chain 4 1 n=1 Tax=Paludisphaera borealis TaxID=1387353 RepID=A0A1U7CW45_9BACT|nr:proton-conducting transporter membrane subunit [Paludisphaera borealis]APW63118.1 NAD(P)H-quinone oxidoreductase chain 4 1 [Paludisphaera borealis]